MSQNCPVVRILRNPVAGLMGKHGAESSELDAACIDALCEVLGRSLNPQYAMATTATAMLTAGKVPGLVIIWHFDPNEDTRGDRRTLPVSAPLSFPFEPTQLSHSNPGLLALCQTDPTRPKFSERALRRERRLRQFHFVFLAIFLTVLSTFAAHLTSGGRFLSGWKLLIIAFAVLFFALSMRWHYREWLVMPGGVLVPEWSFRQFARTYHHYASRDTVLSLTPMVGGWNAVLWRPGGLGQRGQKLLTEIEAIALLAAWQMPVQEHEQRLVI